MELDRNANYLDLTNLMAGGAICLPVILLGYSLAQSEGVLGAGLALLLGNSLLLVLALLSARMSVEKRFSTAENAREYFGEGGVRLVGLLLAITMLGWFAIQLNLMTVALQSRLDLPFLPLNLALGALLVLGCLKGFKGITFLANLAVPALIGTLLVVVPAPSEVAIDGSFSLTGLSLAMAAGIGGVMDYPTYFRYARSLKDAQRATYLLFLVALPLVEGVGVLLGAAYPEVNLVEALSRGGNGMWQLWISLFVLLAGWTTNNANLYSAVTGLQSVTRLESRQLTLLAGGGAVALSCFDLLARFGHVLELMGLLLSAICGVILTRYALKQRGLPFINQVALVIGLFSGVSVFLAEGPGLLTAGFIAALTVGLGTLIEGKRANEQLV